MPHSNAARNSQILVISQSRINLVVIADIVKRSGLRCEPALLADAKALFKSKRPHLIIVDGGPENNDVQALAEGIGGLKQTSDGKPPRVLLLSNQNGTPDSVGLPSIVDEVLPKPITLEALQPVLHRVMRYGT